MRLYGLLAEFDSPDKLLEAARRAREHGYERLDAFTPFPVEGLAEAVGAADHRLPALVLAGGILGALGGYGMQLYAAAVDYPLDIGGRPLNSWPAFIPITFELTVLIAALFAFFGVFILNGLPRPHHPVFDVPAFARASRDRFFLCLEARSRQFDVPVARSFLKSLKPEAIHDIPA